jgi:hypothetical protein
MTLATNIFRSAAGPRRRLAAGSPAQAWANLTGNAMRYVQLARDSAWLTEFLTSPNLGLDNPLRDGSLANAVSAFFQPAKQPSQRHSAGRTTETAQSQISRARIAGSPEAKQRKEKLPAPFLSSSVYRQLSGEPTPSQASRVDRVLRLPFQVEEHFLRQAASRNQEHHPGDAGNNILVAQSPGQAPRTVRGRQKGRATAESLRDLHQRTVTHSSAVPSARTRWSFDFTPDAVREWQAKSIRRVEKLLHTSGGRVLQSHDTARLEQQWAAGIQGPEADAELLREAVLACPSQDGRSSHSRHRDSATDKPRLRTHSVAVAGAIRDEPEAIHVSDNLFPRAGALSSAFPLSSGVDRAAEAEIHQRDSATDKLRSRSHSAVDAGAIRDELDAIHVSDNLFPRARAFSSAFPLNSGVDRAAEAEILNAETRERRLGKETPSPAMHLSEDESFFRDSMRLSSPRVGGVREQISPDGLQRNSAAEMSLRPPQRPNPVLDEDLSSLAERMKRVLDEEARRYGIDV